MKNLLVAQSGGPTSVINATLAGIIETALMSESIDGILGALNGIEGVFGENFVDLRVKFPNTGGLKALALTPSSALGSCRRKIKSEEEIAEIVEILRRRQVTCFIYIGGNDSMDTVAKLSAYCVAHDIKDLTVVGAPKTIDNDLVKIDHCPGFGSAAKYIAATFSELERDCSVYQTKAVTIVEVMGRNAGWLTAASALSRINGGNGPDLIYLCERVFDPEKFIADIQKKQQKKDAVLVAVSEGVKDASGRYISEGGEESTVDAFGHAYIAGAAKAMEALVRDRIGCKVRAVELNLMQRCSGHIVSATDIEESRNLGRKACQCALKGGTGMMATITRVRNDPYTIRYGEVPVGEVANFEKKVPDRYINEEGNDITDEMWEYLEPLIQGEEHIRYTNGIPEHVILY